MPRKPAIIDIQLNSIAACLTPVLALLNELLHCFGAPFVQAISNTALNLVSAVQNAKTNKEECMKLTEHIHEILFAIIKLHMQSEPPGGFLPPATLHHIGNFTKTLHKIHTFVEAQQNQSRIKHFLKQGEMRMLLKECWEGLQDALEVFKASLILATTKEPCDGATIVTDALKMQETTQNLHEELLDLILNMTEGSSDRSSSMYHSISGSENRLLPAKPKIFHGRESELHEILQNFCNKEAPRVAILGAGGIGKTSLAKAALHHPDISAKYETKLFVACDLATTSIELAALVGSNIGLKPGRDLTKPVVQHVAQGPPSLLVLDNLETPWEKIESRGGVEEFLSLLTDVQHLALIITMRGSERPAKVRWTHPFLPPLGPLSDDAAWQTFIDITDNDHDSQKITQLLEIADNLPLAVDLLAHLVDYEGVSSVLARWKTEKTYMLSKGHDKSSNLNASIALSLSSPRMTSGAKGLLSLLSILPDGLSNSELIHSNLPIPDLLTCKAVLLQTSLAYSDNIRLKVLVPVREHVQHVHPPSPNLVQPLRKHFHSLLDLYRTHFGVQINGMADQINSNLHNIHNILLQSLHLENPELMENIYCILSFNSFRRLAGHGRSALMDHIPRLLAQLPDPRLDTNFTIEVLLTANHYPVSDPDILIDRAVHHLTNLNDAALASKFYDVAGGYYLNRRNDIAMSLQFFDKALTLARDCANVQQQALTLNSLGLTKHTIGDYSGAQKHAREAQKMSQICGNVYQEALALYNQTACCSYLGNDKATITLCQEARQLLQLCGMHGGQLDDAITTTIAGVHSTKSEYAEARRIFTIIVHRTSPTKGPSAYALSLINIAQIDVMTGGPKDLVESNIEQATQIFAVMQVPAALDWCKLVLADLMLRERNIPKAKNLFQEGLNSQWGKNADAVNYALSRLADVSCWTLDEIEWSWRWAVVYLAYAEKLQQKVDLYKALQCIGDGFMLQGDTDTAHSLFEVALAEFTQLDIHQRRADCMLRLGDIAKERRDFLKAIRLWKDARPLFERSLQANKIAKIDTRLAAVDTHTLQQHEESLQILSCLRTSLDTGIDQLDIEAAKDMGPSEEPAYFDDVPSVPELSETMHITQFTRATLQILGMLRVSVRARARTATLAVNEGQAPHRLQAADAQRPASWHAQHVEVVPVRGVSSGRALLNHSDTAEGIFGVPTHGLTENRTPDFPSNNMQTFHIDHRHEKEWFPSNGLTKNRTPDFPSTNIQILYITTESVTITPPSHESNDQNAK
ncbi:hypothetical protein FB451DRAFT_1529027 [Mycena latifolia]|nr:hypothetical protein FB451DRAFT_1529027 [Mycena latifolia]